MPYIRRRGNHLAIVHGARHPETKKVEQQVLMTLHSKAEALAALGRTSQLPGRPFKVWMQERYPEIRFSWPKLEAAIDELKNELPDIAKSREARSVGGFSDALGSFARHILEADPQVLDSAREVIESNRVVLEWLMETVHRRLEASERTEPSAYSQDPFGWRLALSGGTMDPGLEEGIAKRIYDGRPREAEQIFLFLTGLYPRYAEAWNYLGLISLEREDLEEALERFERCEKVGRKLFPKRIAKRDYWGRLETRPYIRGLRNQWTVLNRLGRHARALSLAGRLEKECGDDITAALYRSATYLNSSEWQLARDAALHTVDLYAEQSLIVAFVAYELGELDEARARFVHATLNGPRAVGLVLGKRSRDPRTTMEITDHNAGVSLLHDIAGYRSSRSASSRQFFARCWDEEALRARRAEVSALDARMQELRGPGCDEEEHSRLFARARELETWEFAKEVASLGWPAL